MHVLFPDYVIFLYFFICSWQIRNMCDPNKCLLCFKSLVNIRANSVDCAICIYASKYCSKFNAVMKKFLDGNIVCTAVSCEIAFPSSSLCSSFYYAATAITFFTPHGYNICAGPF